MARLIAARDAAEWQAALAPRDCCCTVVASLDEATRDPHFVARGLFQVQARTASGASVPATPLPIAPHLRKGLDVERPVAGLGGAGG